MPKTPLIKSIGNGMRSIMNIVNRVLTLNQLTDTRTVECIAGCRVELTALEIAGLANPFNRGFTLRCVLLAGDPGPDPVIFTFPLVRTFRNVADILDADDLFREELSEELLDEDARGADEIKAMFTLVNNDNGQSVRRRSPRVTIVL
jgi:hypothetical protein